MSHPKPKAKRKAKIGVSKRAKEVKQSRKTSLLSNINLPADIDGQKFSEESLNRLRKQLPHPYSSILQERVFKRTGIKYPEASIRRHLMMKYLSIDTLEEAIILAAEEIDRKRQLAILMGRNRRK